MTKKRNNNVPVELTNFKNFLYIVWKHLDLPAPTTIQYEMADYLQNGPKRLCIQAFRGAGKSWITSAFSVWNWFINPQRNILVVSASKTRSDDFSTFTQRIINEIPILEHLKPRTDQRSSKVSFDVGPARASHAPSCKSMGITGQLTGSRADLIIADDVESANNSQTQLMRERLSETVKEFDSIIKPEVGRIIFLGTPQTELSLYNSLEERGFETQIWPARYPVSTVTYGNKLAKSLRDNVRRLKAGEPTDPKRFDETDLMEREASYGRSGFSLQFMLDTTLADINQYPLKLNDLIVMSGTKSWKQAPGKVQWASSMDQIKALDPELPNVGLKGDYYVAPMYTSQDYYDFEGSVMAIDPAGRGADKTAYAIVKMLNGILYLTDAGAMDGGYDEDTLSSLANIAKSQEVNQIVIESNFGDGMFLKLLDPVLQKIYPCSTDEIRSNVQKEKRIIDTLEPVMNSHRLVVDQDLIYDDFKLDKQHQLFHQMTRLTRTKGCLRHDDLIDVLGMAVNYWTTTIGRNVDDAEQEAKEERLNQELDRFMEHSIGRSNYSNNSFID
jgi:hypothetical protein|tara:strand:- start:2911 stop:4581 length:1671 start_codon:yes stop_codon:yes gene_type:complete